MSSTFNVQNLNVSSQATVSGNIVLDRATADLTITAADQTSAASANLPDLGGVSQDLLLTSQTQTVSNKTVQSSTIETTTVIADNTDSSKQVAVDLTGATTSTSTTLDFNQTANRTIAFPDSDGTVGLQPSGTDNQLIRMDGTSAMQSSTVTLGDTGALANVLSVGGTAGADLTLQSQTGQSVVLTSDTGVSVTNDATVGGTLGVTGAATFSSDVTVAGDLTVNGTTTSVNSQVVTIADNNLLLSSNYTTAAARAGGITVNYLPTATADTSTTGGFATTTTVNTTGAATFAANDIILITGATDVTNNGLFEVASHAANVLTIKSSTTYNFLQNVFAVDAADVTAAITKVTVAVLQAGSDGRFEVAQGSDTSMTFTDLALVSELPSGTWTEIDVQTTDATLTTAATIATTTDRSQTLEIVYAGRSTTTTASNCGKVTREFYNSSGTANTMGAGVSSYSVQGVGSTWAASASASGANMLVQVQGDATETVNWRLLYRVVESPSI